MIHSVVRSRSAAAPAAGKAELETCSFRLPAGGSDGDAETCEDAPPLLHRFENGGVLLGVADGLGGYAHGFDGRSGGYIASRCVLQALAAYFDDSGIEDAADTADLTNHLYRKLRFLLETRLPPVRIHGSLGRHRLATTLAALHACGGQGHGEFRVNCYWIGDSRVYLLDSRGLYPLSEDDSAGNTNAFQSLYEQPPMSRFLAATMERDWFVHHRCFNIRVQGVLLLCTDGCYSALDSPWRFESVLHQTLADSAGWSDWVSRLETRIGLVCSDDASLIALPVNAVEFRDFRRLRLRQAKESVLVRALRAESDRTLDAAEIWTRIYAPGYESGADGMESVECGDDSPAVQVTTSRRFGLRWLRLGARGPARRHLALWLLLAWVVGLVCGLLIAIPDGPAKLFSINGADRLWLFI